MLHSSRHPNACLCVTCADRRRPPSHASSVVAALFKEVFGIDLRDQPAGVPEAEKMMANASRPSAECFPPKPWPKDPGLSFPGVLNTAGEGESRTDKAFREYARTLQVALAQRLEALNEVCKKNADLTEQIRVLNLDIARKVTQRLEAHNELCKRNVDLTEQVRVLKLDLAENKRMADLRLGIIGELRDGRDYQLLDAVRRNRVVLKAILS